ncbi:hypothetical protein [Streptomyces sp. 7N604]|uniref:hypothetical protein n=1 Tax=Streptomyces sp. 7N604 TaxID=3457415 RepID=UPI003FD44B18
MPSQPGPPLLSAQERAHETQGRPRPSPTASTRPSSDKAVVWDVATQGALHHLGILSHFRTVLWYPGAGQDDGGFETALGPWAVQGPPPGSQVTGADWARSKELFRSSAAVTTRDTVLLGFGLEHVARVNERSRLIAAALRALRR